MGERRIKSRFTPPEPHPVFEDLSHRRSRVLSKVVSVSLLVLILWVFEFGLRVFDLRPLTINDEQLLREVAGPRSSPLSDASDVVMTEGAETDCRQGLLGAFHEPAGVSGYVPYDDQTALSGLRARCSELDSVFYEAFTFRSPEGGIQALGVGSADFPLQEFQSNWKGRNRPQAFPIVRPVEGLSGDGLQVLFDPSGAGRVIAKDIAEMTLDGVDGGLCLDLSRYSGVAAETVTPILKAMNLRLQPAGLSTCLIGAADAQFWRSAELMQSVDQVVALAFRTTEVPAALAPHKWTAATLASIEESVPSAKLSIGLGTFGSTWKSGQRDSELISYAESMVRASLFEGDISFGSDIRNTSIRYLDQQRQLNQIWLLDALYFHNTRLLAGRTRPIILWPLGYEDPAIWQMLGSEKEDEAAIEMPLDLSDHAVIEGAGPFSGLIKAASPGNRQVVTDGSNGPVIAQSYGQVPIPHRIRFFGDEAVEGQLAISFNGLGGPREMQELLLLLDEHEIAATFFVSTRDLALNGELLPEILAAGHNIGAATLPRASQSWVSGVLSRYQNNLTQHYLSHLYGYRARLVRNPTRYGPLPSDVALLSQLQDMLASGYLPVQSSVPAAYGKIDEDAFVERVRDAALARPVNILSMDFSAEGDRGTLSSLPNILTTLQKDGLTFHSLPDMAGLEIAEALPRSGTVVRKRDEVTYTIMRTSWLGAQTFILLLALIVALRSPIYLVLAFMRRSKYPFDRQFHPAVTVVVPAFNEEMVIESTVQSILKTNYPDCRITVVDDGSTDNTAAIVKKRFGKESRVTLLHQENQGKWCALDLAVAHVKTQFIVIVDADTILDPDALSLLVQPFKNEKIGAVAGTVEVGNRDNLLTTFQVVEYMYTQQVLRRAYEVFDGVIVVPGAIGAWRVKAIHEAGEVSGDTITEDADLTIAVHRAGYSVAYQEDAKSYTEVPNSVKAFMRQRLRWTFGMFQVSWKHARSITEGRPVGYISLVDAVWYGLITSLIYPIMDAIFIWAFLYWGYAFVVEGFAAFKDFPLTGSMAFLMLTVFDLANLAASFWFSRRVDWGLLLAVPFLRFGYRQLLYVSSLRAIFRALVGHSARWNKLNRTGTAIPKTEARGELQ